MSMQQRKDDMFEKSLSRPPVYPKTPIPSTRAACPVLDCAPDLQKSIPGSCCKQCIMPEEVKTQCSQGGKYYEASRMASRGNLMIADRLKVFVWYLVTLITRLLTVKSILSKELESTN
ncbi:hypothetical protein BDFB_003066 [Asbolus verrucosus]|uniref:Uncharacterized protein n=1 Tax=Asbolus verrucosus TaxID=1661398 RepID=A0A482WEI4_ASBVE|nr:hypothetical protein BDFB_003066 [Asbolus verrucosus]